jgi:sulfatase maturation enzyme AslB (radical SAM superfamily)
MGAAVDPPPREIGPVLSDGIEFLHGFGTVDHDPDGVAQIVAQSLCVVRRTGGQRYFQCHLDFPAERGELVACLGDRVVDHAELTRGWQHSAFALEDVPVPAELRLAFRDAQGAPVEGVRIRSVFLSDSWGRGQRKRLKCSMPFDRAVVVQDFDVFMCSCPEWLKRGGVLGNTKEARLTDIWNGAPYQRMRGLFLEHRYGEVCREEVCPLLLGEIKTPEPSPEVIAAVNDGHTVMAHGPNSIQHDVDRGCNLECVMCRDEKILPREENVERGLRDVQDAIALDSVIDLTWSGAGEIFAMKKIVQSLESDTYARRGIKLNLVTNLTYFNDKLWQRIGHNRIGIITMSADGCSPEVYNSIRVGADWDTVAANMRLLAEIRRQGRVESVVWNYTVLRRNVCDVAKAIRFADALGFDRFRLIAQFGELSRTEGNIFESFDLDALDALHAELESVDAFDNPMVWMFEIGMRGRRYRTPEFALAFAQHVYERQGYGSDGAEPSLYNLAKALKIVGRLMHDIGSGRIPRPQRLPDGALRFLERLANHAERHYQPDPGAAPEAAEARAAAAGTRALLARLG